MCPGDAPPWTAPSRFLHAGSVAVGLPGSRALSSQAQGIGAHDGRGRTSSKREPSVSCAEETGATQKDKGPWLCGRVLD